MPMYLPDSKEKFPRTPDGKALLRTPEEIARWIALGYVEQRARRPQAPRLKIDLAGCDLATHVPKSSKGASLPRFSLSKLAGLAEGIREDGERTAVSYPVDLSGSVLHNPCLCDLAFENRVVMREVTVEGYMSVVNSVFGAETAMSGFAVRGKMLFKGNVFRGDVVLKKIIFAETCRLSIDGCVFSSSFTASGLQMSCAGLKPPLCLGIKDSRFDGPVSLEGSSFDGEIKIRRTGFGQHFAMSDNILPGRMYLEKCTVQEGMTILSGADTPASPDTRIKFDRIELNGRLHFYRLHADRVGMQMCSVSPAGRIKFTDAHLNVLGMKECTVSGRADIIGGTVGRINLRETLCDGYITVLDTRFRDLTNSYTARLLKDQALKSNDTIRALDYRKAEMNLYLGELTRRRTVSAPEGGGKKEPVYDYLRRLRPGKIFLLLFNKLSNDYGRSWGRGVLFTALAAALFFAAVWRWGLESPPSAPRFGDVWKSYLQILNLANWKDSLNGHELDALGVTLFYLSRVFVSYGIYQTVAAFRKYGR